MRYLYHKNDKLYNAKFEEISQLLVERNVLIKLFETNGFDLNQLRNNKQAIGYKLICMEDTNNDNAYIIVNFNKPTDNLYIRSATKMLVTFDNHLWYEFYDSKFSSAVLNINTEDNISANEFNILKLRCDEVKNELKFINMKNISKAIFKLKKGEVFKSIFVYRNAFTICKQIKTNISMKDNIISISGFTKNISTLYVTILNNKDIIKRTLKEY